MIPWLGAAFLVGGFLVLLRCLGLVNRSRDVLALTRGSLRVIGDEAVDDEVKEAALRRNALLLFRLCGILTVGGAAAVLLPLAVLWGADRLGWMSLAAVMAVAVSWPFLTVSGVVALGVMVYPARRSVASDADDPGARYAAADRWLHRVAFATGRAQIAMADIEDGLAGRALAGCPAARPVFITGLPRAGTTLLLECLAGLPGFASHCYRDMPFVLIPWMWDRFSASFRRHGARRERAHGDGMLIDVDSPEALEEMLWLAFWPEHYRADRIVPWRADASHEEFETFFRRHMQKIVLLRCGPAAGEARYVSKNNLNIARTAMLRRRFADAVVVVPFRDPIQHAASLREQHRNFLRIHAADPFACDYMRALGHFDFGDNLRPVDFNGWIASRETRDAESLAFWLTYWTAAYRYLLEEGGAPVFMGYDDLCARPRVLLSRLAEVLDSRDGGALAATASRFRPPRSRDIDTAALPWDLLKEARAIHERLQDAALR